MFCTNCGKEIKDGASFCTGCGKKVKNAVQENQPEEIKQIVVETDRTLSEERETQIEENEKEVKNAEEITTETETQQTDSGEPDKDPNIFQFSKDVWEFKSVTDVELKGETITIDKGIHFLKNSKLFRKNYDVRLQDIANISLRKRVPMASFFLGLFFTVLTILFVAESGFSIKALAIGVLAIVGLVTRYFAVVIYDRNNRTITIATESENEQECERFINTINNAMDNNGIPRYNPATFKEPFYQSNIFRMAIPILIAVCIGIGVSGSFLGGSEIAEVQNGNFEVYQTATVGEILDYSIDELTWESFEVADGQMVVNATGYFEGSDILLQFLVEESENGFELYAIQIDGEVCDESMQGLLLMALLINYDNNLGDGTLADRMEAEIGSALIDTMYNW